MRKALNENPMVQIAVLAVGVIALGLILMMSMGGGGSDTTTTSDPGAATPDLAATPETATSGGTDVPGAPSAAAPSTPDSAAAPPATDSSAGTGSSAVPDADASAGSVDSADGMLPSKGLPQDLLVAYAKGDAIVLLVSNPRSLSDPKMKSAVRDLQHRDDVATFTVPSDEIAKYSRITSGISVSRVPALVVIRPRNLTDNVPTATVSYGFRGKESVAQAVDDALYEGRRRPAYP